MDTEIKIILINLSFRTRELEYVCLKFDAVKLIWGILWDEEEIDGA